MVPFQMCKSSDTKALHTVQAFELTAEYELDDPSSLKTEFQISVCQLTEQCPTLPQAVLHEFGPVFLDHVHSCCLHCMMTFNLHLWMSLSRVHRHRVGALISITESCRVLMHSCRRAWTSRTSSTDVQPCSVHTDISTDSFDDIMNCRWWHIHNFNIYLLRIRI